MPDRCPVSMNVHRCECVYGLCSHGAVCDCVVSCHADGEEQVRTRRWHQAHGAQANARQAKGLASSSL